MRGKESLLVGAVALVGILAILLMFGTFDGDISGQPIFSLFIGKPSCVDSDGGIAPYVFGAAQGKWLTRGGHGVYEDACSDAKTLLEVYCSTGGYVYYVEEKCDCTSGVCA